MELPDAQAVELAARGDAEAFMVLVRRYRGPLIAYIHGRTRARDEAEDIAQEAFCRAWERVATLREPAAFSGWLFRIARNAAVTASRKPRPAPLAVEPVSTDGNRLSMDTSVEIHAAVAQLSDQCRTVVSLRHFSGMATEEVAAVLGIPPGTVRSRLSRAYAQLRRRLANRVEV